MRARIALALALAGVTVRGAADYRGVAAADFESVLPVAARDNRVQLAPYRLAALPVTNGAFLAFVTAHPAWQRGKVPALFADASYLRHWEGPLTLGRADPRQPVTQVSWFAAVAYCEARAARLPRWHEWEWAAAADARRLDARGDRAWRQRILDWYARPAAAGLRRAGLSAPNVHGVHDLHGLIWEWVEDFGALMVSGDNREQGDPDLIRFCGSGALTMAQKEHYAVLMRVAMLSSLRGRSTASSLGFRCARDGLR